MLQPKDPGKMQSAFEVQVMNHVTRRQLKLGESGIRAAELVQDGMTSNPFDYGITLQRA